MNTDRGWPRPFPGAAPLLLEADLDASGFDCGVLSEAELARVARLRDERLRRRQRQALALLRHALGHALDLAPAGLVFGTGKAGKPFLVGVRPVEFNLSHAGAHALLALAAVPVGVDIEAESALAEDAAFLDWLLAPAERRAYQALRPDARRRWLCQRWCRKEALLKATGEGLGDAAGASIDLGDSGGEATIAVVRGGIEWQLIDLVAPEGCRAALCQPAPGTIPSRWRHGPDGWVPAAD